MDKYSAEERKNWYRPDIKKYLDESIVNAIMSWPEEATKDVKDRFFERLQGDLKYQELGDVRRELEKRQKSIAKEKNKDPKTYWETRDFWPLLYANRAASSFYERKAYANSFWSRWIALASAFVAVVALVLTLVKSPIVNHELTIEQKTLAQIKAGLEEIYVGRIRGLEAKIDKIEETIAARSPEK